MNHNSVNEFLPPGAGHAPHVDDMEEDEFDMARFSAIRKEQKDELERLDHHHHNKQLQIENQIRGEVDRLFAHFQQGMQNLYTGLTQTINATVEAQVKLRMEQERLREDHAANKREVERRYHNEASKIVMSTSNPARHAQPLGHAKSQSFLRAPNSSLPAGPPAMPTPNGDQHISPATAPATLSPPFRRQVMAKPAAINPMPREYGGHETQHREYVAPYPTPQEPVPTQRKPVPSERRQAEPRHAEPRQVEPHHSDPQPVGPGPRPMEQHIEPRPVEHRPVAPRHVEPRPTGHQSVEPIPSEPSLAEPRHMEHRHIEPRPVEARPVETRPENHARPIMARPIYEEPMTMEPKPTMPHEVNPSHQAERLSETSTSSPSFQETKRKAVGSPDLAAGGLHPKRPRTKERMAEEAMGQSSSKRSPRARRSSHAPLETRVERTIPFAKVYQNGQAQYKHRIFEDKEGSGNWYIVRCDEHGVHFGFSNPVHGAAKHVHSPQHNKMEKTHDLAIEICGHRVLDCNAELAQLNNDEFERAVKEDKYKPFNRNLLTKEGRRRLTDGLQQETDPDKGGDSKRKRKPSPLKTAPDVTVPEECRFYQGFWRATKKWYMLIILPIRPDGNLREVGLREKLQETDLMGNIPKCYRVDRVSLQIKGWQPAYEDGGPKVARREYPVMFFESSRKHSVGWLSVQKLRPVDLDNPPNNIDKKGLSVAREWYAQHMMHRPSWDDLKRLGRGEPPSTSSSTSNPDQWPSLRSAHTDDQSPIRDKSSGPGHFEFGSSSEEDSDDDEDPMTMDVGPIPEPEDSNYVAESGPDDSDVEMQDTRAAGNKDDVDDVIRPGRRRSQVASSRPGSRRGPEAESKQAMPEGSNQGRPDEATTGPPTPPTANDGNQHEGLSAVLSDQEHLRKSAQAKAAAAVMEAASRSRASSEVPDNAGETHAQPAYPSRPPFAEHNRSRSEDFARLHAEAPLSAQGSSKMNEGRKPSDLHSILNAEHGPKQPEPADENHADPYKRFEAIKAQMNGLRSASAPVHERSGTQSPFSPPPVLSGPAATKEASAQPSPSLSHIMSPPSQTAATVLSRSSSNTPVQESGSSTPMVTIPGGGHPNPRHAMRNGPVGPPAPSQSQTPHASFATMPLTDAGPNGHGYGDGETATKKPSAPTAQLGTPIPEKRESFEVSQFRDTARGMRWSRDGPSTPFLRLNTDPMRGWAETAGGAPLTAGIEPLKVARIEVEAPGADRQKVQLTLKDGNEQVVMFETNSANGRSQSATLQGRRFVSWLRKMNGEVELRSGYVSGSSVSVS